MARGFNDLSNLMTYVEKSCDYPINEELVQEVLLALDLNAEDADKLKDGEGNVTLESIKSYVDILIKNLPESVDLTQLKDQIDQLLARVETDLLVAVKEEIQKYEPQIKQIIDSAQIMVTALEGATFINSEVEEVINDVNSILEGVLSDIENGELSSQKLKGYADRANQKADEFLVKIKSDLSEEELAQIEKSIQDMEETLALAKKSMEDSISVAEKSIKDGFEKRREERRGGKDGKG